MPDAVVIGSGPNGLAAAIELARNGRSVAIYEANDTIGGGCRSAELTLPGFIHDLCSAFHPMGAASPFFRALDLAKEGLEWIQPPVAMAHPLDDGTAVLLERSLDATAAGLGPDGRAYRRLVEPLVGEWDDLAADALGPLLRVPRHPFVLAR
ncbi:MAG TPA: FAD-dependent oxidoreductase, partial [Candidatus Limnocylindria bacterium]|nr:FAD-dependent oxidoreductase [Candidatus Limnocylindria bacterium]